MEDENLMMTTDLIIRIRTGQYAKKNRSERSHRGGGPDTGVGGRTQGRGAGHRGEGPDIGVGGRTQG